MSDSGYTPWREKVLESWLYFTNRNYEVPEQLREGTAELDRFFAAHDAEVAAKAWDEGAQFAAVECNAIDDETQGWVTPSDNPYRDQIGESK